MIERLIVHDVTIVRPAVKVGRGSDTVKDWATATRSTVKGWISQTGTNDNTAGPGVREAAVSQWVLFTLPTVDVRPGDRIEWGSLTFEVDGTPHPAWTPQGHHHTECKLKAVDG